MQILMLTSLFPPDTGAPAPYAKLLAEHLNEHELEVIVYGNLPESVPNVSIHSIEKRGAKFPLIVRTIQTLRKSPATLWLIQAGPSTELPALIASYLKNTPLILLESDPRLVQKVNRGLYKLLRTLLQKRALATIEIPKDSSVFLPDEWLPFSTHPSADEQIDSWWQTHIDTLLSYGKH